MLWFFMVPLRGVLQTLMMMEIENRHTAQIKHTREGRQVERYRQKLLWKAERLRVRKHLSLVNIIYNIWYYVIHNISYYIYGSNTQFWLKIKGHVLFMVKHHQHYIQPITSNCLFQSYIGENGGWLMRYCCVGLLDFHSLYHLTVSHLYKRDKLTSYCLFLSAAPL